MFVASITESKIIIAFVKIHPNISRFRYRPTLQLLQKEIN